MFVFLQHLLPHHAISRLVHWLTRRRWAWMKNAAIRGFVRAFRVDLSDAEHARPEHYATFNAFFTRALRDGARPADPAPDALLCPVDGTVSQCGHIADGRIYQAKGRDYALSALLGDDAELTQALTGGDFATLYLAPYNYHRIHMPVGGRLTSMRLVPGRLFSVNAATARGVDRLFARNERVVCRFDTDVGPMAMVLVGALNVGSIETVWAGEVTPGGGRKPRLWTYPDAGPDAVALARGAEMGRFNMGSTVILLMAPGAATWSTQLEPGHTVRVGERLAMLGAC